MRSPDYSYHFDQHNRTAMVAAEEQVRDLIFQLLFTTPGERVMRPGFGSGLLQLTFEPNSEQLIATTQMLVAGALQEYLADRITTHDVKIEARDSSVFVSVDYTVIETQLRVTTEMVGAAT